MQNLCGRPLIRLASQRACRLIARPLKRFLPPPRRRDSLSQEDVPHEDPADRQLPQTTHGNDPMSREAVMDDLLWIAVMLGLLAVTLAYVRLCDAA